MKHNLTIILFVLVLLGCVSCTPKATVATDNIEYIKQIEHRTDSVLASWHRAEKIHDTIVLRSEKVVTINNNSETIKVVEQINNGKIRYATKTDTIIKYVAQHNYSADTTEVKTKRAEVKTDIGVSAVSIFWALVFVCSILLLAKIKK